MLRFKDTFRMQDVCMGDGGIFICASVHVSSFFSLRDACVTAG